MHNTIICCCDGTGNEISENISNVLKLYRCLRKAEKTQPRQMVCGPRCPHGSSSSFIVHPLGRGT
jgi:hypothetical protein